MGNFISRKKIPHKNTKLKNISPIFVYRNSEVVNMQKVNNQKIGNIMKNKKYDYYQYENYNLFDILDTIRQDACDRQPTVEHSTIYDMSTIYETKTLL